MSNRTKRLKVETVSTDKYFDGLYFYVLPAKFGTKRLEIFKKQIEKFGGISKIDLSSDCDSKLLHVIVEETVDKNQLDKLVNTSDILDDFIILKCTWISRCLKNKSLIDYLQDEVLASSEFEKTNIDKKEVKIELSSSTKTVQSNEKEKIKKHDFETTSETQDIDDISQPKTSKYCDNLSNENGTKRKKLQVNVFKKI